MFQLFDLIVTSPIGVYVGNAVANIAYAALTLADCDECGFNDLGKLLFGGLILAALVGVSASLLYRRSRNSNSDDSQFVSIRASQPTKKTGAN